MNTIPLHPSFGSVLRKYRKTAQVKQAQIAEEMGVTPTTYLNWENDKNKPYFDQVRYLCTRFKIPVHELFGLVSPTSGNTSDEQEIVNLYRRLSPSNKYYVKRVLKELDIAEQDYVFQQAAENRHLIGYSEQSMAAGEDSCPVYESLYCGVLFYRKTNENNNADIVMRVLGNSMEPTFHNGDKVYVKLCDSADPGTVVFATWNEYAVIKRLGSDGTLRSDNINEPFSTKYEDNNVTIRGIVLGRVKDDDCFSDEMQKLLQGEYGTEIRAYKKKHNIIDTM